MRAHRHSSNSTNAVQSISRQSKRVSPVVGVAIEQLSIGTTVSDGTKCIPVTSLLKGRHRTNRRAGAAKTAEASHDAGLRIADDIVC